MRGAAIRAILEQHRVTPIQAVYTDWGKEYTRTFNTLAEYRTWLASMGQFAWEMYCRGEGAPGIQDHFKLVVTFPDGRIERPD